MSDLGGLCVALLEARMPEELSALVRRHGGEPRCVAAVREERVPGDGAVGELLDVAARERDPVVVLSTGAGVAALFAGARALGREGELRGLLGRATTVCRGPKPAAALQREGLAGSVRVAAPYTTAELLDALRPLPLAARLVAILHYGERNQPLVGAVTGHGARVHEVLLYEWRLPEDLAPLRQLVTEICDGRLGAILFTSQVQARHLFAVAGTMGAALALGEALRTRTIVAAVGPTCAAALESLGVRPHVVPANPKMGAAVAALAAFVRERRARVAAGPSSAGTATPAPARGE
jgi:uroporphyrinogen-III synthase